MANPVGFRFDPGQWLGNLRLRVCSHAARAFWVDLLCLMHQEGGYLTIAGKPISDDQLARLTGEPLGKVQTWLTELGDVGMYQVNAEGVMYYKPFINSATHGDKIRVARLTSRAQAVGEMPSAVPEHQETPLEGAPAPKPRPTPLPWYATPAGWARKGGEAALSIGPTETLEDFQVRVSVRIPPGPHLEALSEWQRKAIADKIPKMG